MTCHVNDDCDGYAIEMHAAKTFNLSKKGMLGKWVKITFNNIITESEV